MPQVDNTTQQITANVALTTTEAQVAQFTAAGNPQPSPSRTGPWALVIATLPNVTGLAAAASVTLNIRAGTTSAGTLLGSGTATNSGAGAAAAGPVVAMALVPAGTDGALFVGALVSAGTGTAAASATAPIVVAVINLD